jgi:N-acyl amino acid synthase of PEP-CTERM/exosortase system
MSDDPRPDLPLLGLYEKYFQVISADSPEMLAKAHALRYQVYCVEHAFLDPAMQSNDEEWDLYDAHSAHAVLISKPSNDVVGCIRLVLPAPDGSGALPLRELLGEAERAKLDTLGPRRIAEISRYAISKRYRRRPGESLYPDVNWNEPSPTEIRRLMPHMSLGLIRGSCLLAAQHGVETVCAAMAPALLRLLERLGLFFEPLGPPIDYHGLRQPCVAEGKKLLAGMAAFKPDYYEVVSQVPSLPGAQPRIT